MSPFSLDLLEFHKIKHLLSERAVSSLGKEKINGLEPMQDADMIREELNFVTEMTEAVSARQSPPLDNLIDVRMLVRRAVIGSMLSADELLDVKKVLSCTGAAYRYRMKLDERLRGLNSLLEPIPDLGLTAKTIEGCVDPRGKLLDMASSELGAVRKQIHDLDEKAQRTIARLLNDPEIRKILRYANATVSGEHYVLPVPVNYRRHVPGVVHRTSSTGETVFIEPAQVAGLSAERSLLKTDEDKEERRILRKLTAEVAGVAQPLLEAVEILARLDFITAKARLSVDFGMHPPEILEATEQAIGNRQEARGRREQALGNRQQATGKREEVGGTREGYLWLADARHPILQHLFSKQTPSSPVARSLLPVASPRPVASPIPNPQSPTPSPQNVVPISLHLGKDFNILVITGPNTGGKTVTLKTVGLLCLMAQSGLHIPAGQGSRLPVFHHILADIGDEQSLEQSLSTFSSHISRISEILRTADGRSLILLDELGAGTDPTEGAALGRAILDKLAQIGCMAMVTTHLGDLKTYAFTNECAENAAVEFDTETLRPTYRLHIGQYGMSNALKIARRLKLPRDLLQRAHRYLKRKNKRAPEMARLQQAREEAERARVQAIEAEVAARGQEQSLKKSLKEMERQAEREAALKRARLALQPGDRVCVAHLEREGSIVRVDFRKNRAVVRAGVGQWEMSLEELIPVTAGDE